MADADTFPKLLLHHAATRPDAPAVREKDYGIWQTWTWSQAAAEVRALACGLAALGLARGRNLAVIGDNRPRLYWSMTAAQVLGSIPVPLYQDAVADEMVYILNDSEVHFAIVENQEQADKLLEVKARCPHLQVIIYDDPRGLRHYAQPFLKSYDEVSSLGRAYDRDHPSFFTDALTATRPEDVSVMLYTSGTTGKPKGVCQTHHAFVESARGACGFDKLDAHDDVLSYLPMAWVGDHLFSYVQALYAGLTINCPESSETVINDMREIGPTYFFAPPRIYEGLLTQVMIRMEDAAAVKRRLFHYFMEVARGCGAEILDGAPVPFAKRLQYALGNLLVYGPLRNVLGMSRVRVAYTAGAAIGPDLFRFYRSIGVNLKQLYGSTETCAYVCLQPSGAVKLESVGRPAPGVEVRIADNGEVLVRGPMLLKEYHKRPDATAESIDADGWFHTGDAGFFDESGDLRIIDRAQDVGKLANGALFAPNYVENKLKFFPYVKEAVAFGHAREHVCVFVNIDMPAVGNWAERRGIAYSGYTDLAAREEVYELVSGCIERMNTELAADGVLMHS